MSIDLKFALPFALPFLFLALIRALYWLAAAEWSDPGLAAFLSLFAGQIVGWIAVGVMGDNGISFVVRIPAARQGGEQ